MKLSEIVKKENLQNKKLLINVRLADIKNPKESIFGGYFCYNNGLYQNAPEDEYDDWTEMLRADILDYGICDAPNSYHSYDAMLCAVFKTRFMNAQEYQAYLDEHRKLIKRKEELIAKLVSETDYVSVWDDESCLGIRSKTNPKHYWNIYRDGDIETFMYINNKHAFDIIIELIKVYLLIEGE